MAGGGKSGGNAARSRKRVEATVLKRSRDGSAFTRCEACNKDVPVVLIDMHSCSLDKHIKEMLEAEVVEKIVEVTTTTKGAGGGGKKSAAKGGKDGKRKHTPTAFFLFMDDFRKEFKAAHPDNKSVSVVAKEGGEKWKSMTDEEKKPYIEKAAELKAQAVNGEGSGENNVAGTKKTKAEDKDGDQEVDQPVKKRIRRKAHDEDEDDAGDQDDDEDDKNDLDDDLDDDDM